jgi:AhpD family alkylhydroperoxidase
MEVSSAPAASSDGVSQADSGGGVIKYLAQLPRAVDGTVATVYDQMRREFGFLAEPLILHAKAPELLAATWATMRETVILEGILPRTVKEMIAMAVSRANRCSYCVDAHGVVLHALGAGEVEQAIFRHREERLPDPQLAAFAAWAAASRTPDAEIVRRPPFSPAQAPEAIGSALCFHYINRMALALLGETPLPTRSPLLRRPLLRFAGRSIAGPARARHEREESRDLPAAETAEHLAWAAASPAVAAAFSRFTAAVERAAQPTLTPETRARVSARLAHWRGEDPPFGSLWITEVAAGLEPAQTAAVRLALLAALAPHRVDEQEIARFRTHWPGDAMLVSVLAWGSFHAARRISEWLFEAPQRVERNPAPMWVM